MKLKSRINPSLGECAAHIRRRFIATTHLVANKTEERRRFAGHLVTGLAMLVMVVRARPYDMFVQYGVGGYLLLFADSFLRKKEPRERIINFYVGSLLVLFPYLILPLADGLEERLRPFVLDQALRLIDLRIGLDGFVLSRLCIAHPWTEPLLQIVYAGLPLAFAVAWLTSRSVRLLRAAVMGAFLCVPVYLLVPACGPEYAFSNWPWSETMASPGAVAMRPRNCVPSMHVSWALLLALNARGRASRVLFTLYTAAMAFATVAGGEHYFIDALVAVPFTLALQWLADKRALESRCDVETRKQHENGIRAGQVS